MVQKVRAGEEAASREFVHWKNLLTMFALLISPLPNKEQIAEYREALKENGSVINKAQFV